MDTALVVGATGLVGSQCLKTLLDSGAYERVVAFTRRPLGQQHPRLVETMVDFDKLEDFGPFPPSDVVCAVFSTSSKVGSHAAYLGVDFEEPRSITDLSAAAGATQFLL